MKDVLENWVFVLPNSYCFNCLVCFWRCRNNPFWFLLYSTVLQSVFVVGFCQ